MAREPEDLLHLGDVVAVEWAPVAYVELFKDVGRQEQRFELHLYFGERRVDVFSVLHVCALGLYIVLEFFVGRVDGQLRQVRGHAADARVYRHFIVVEDDDDFGLDAREGVQRLE